MHRTEILDRVKKMIAEDKNLQIVTDNGFSIRLKDQNNILFNLVITPEYSTHEDELAEALAYTE